MDLKSAEICVQFVDVTNSAILDDFAVPLLASHLQAASAGGPLETSKPAVECTFLNIIINDCGKFSLNL
jgi:hypothetical protein